MPTLSSAFRSGATKIDARTMIAGGGGALLWTIKPWLIQQAAPPIGGQKDVTRVYLNRVLAPNGIKEIYLDLVYAGESHNRPAAVRHHREPQLGAASGA